MVSRFTRLLLCLLGMVALSFCLSAQNNSCGLLNGNLEVTNTNDDGPGSLRNAIHCANELNGPNRITFRISGDNNRKNIFIGSTTGVPLPSLTDIGTVIDGTFQSGATDRPRIVLDGSQFDWNAPVNGLFISGNDCEIYGLEIRNFPDDGIDIFGANNVQIGDVGKGNVIYNCGEERDFYDSVNPSGPWEGSGIALRNGSSFCAIKSNFIGTDARSTNNFANEYCGILITGNSNGNLVGGATFADANKIAFNPTAIRIEASIQNPLLGNSIICNDTAAIVLVNNGNQLKKAPSILLANDRNISGRGIPGDRIEIFLNQSRFCASQICQGQLSVGSANVAQDSTWNFVIRGTPSVGNVNFLEYDLATATATDRNGNTSNFSSCRVVNIETETCADADGIIWVTNTDDDGIGSLRAAIECANNTSGPNRIHFNIEGTTPAIIQVGTSTQQALPALTDNNTIIDASTQNGFSGQPQIILEGNTIEWNTPINALFIRANNCEIYGLEIRNFPDDGIDIWDANNVTIGDANRGNVIYNCGIEQDIWPNVIPSGRWEGCGIVIRGTSRNASIQGNNLGTNFEQSETSGNEYCGISIGGDVQNVVIGGAGSGNTIAYNPTGVLLANGAANIQISQNAFICNDTLAIGLRGNANGGKSAPIITDYSNIEVTGTAESGDLIEVFISSSMICPDQACQGNLLLGSTTADNNGEWILLFEDSRNNFSEETSITATATNRNGETSVFADCFTKAAVDCSNFTVAVSSRQDESCQNSNGAFQLSVTGGTAPYTYDLGNGVSFNPTFTNLSVGTYSVTVLDANGCEATQALAINQSSPLGILITDEENAICGQASGSFSVFAFGSVPPYTYDIGDGAISNFEFTSLSPGNYEVTVTDATGCTETEFVEIEDEDGLQLNLVAVQDASCGEMNGSVVGVATDGIEPIVYELNSQRSNTPTFNNLSPGNYEMLATDANGCNATRTFTIEATLEPELTIVQVTNANCEQQDGTIEVQTNGGTSPVSYNYGLGETTSNIFRNLAPGTYLITATDANGCTDLQSARVEASGFLEVEIESLVDASCNLANGSFIAVPINGSAPYSFDIGNGSSAVGIFNNLAEGEYTVTVNDSQGCETTHDLTIGTISPLLVDVVNIRPANCSTENGGAFTLLPSGGTLPINYDIGNGLTSNPFFINLAPGTYDITATDAIGCSYIESVTIAQEGELNVTGVVRDASCGQANGSFRVASSSGTAPFQIEWNSEIYENVITSLAAGNYEIIVTDAKGCSTTQEIVIQDRNDLEADIQNVQNATCGNANGQFSVVAEGGDAPFTYNIGTGETNSPTFSNLAGGFYEVTVSDANGCQVIESTLVEESVSISAAIVGIENTSCGTQNGQFSVEIISGAAPFTYNIGEGEVSSAMFNNLAGGFYEVTISDANGCEIVESTTIQESATVAAIIVEVVNASCAAENGSFTVEVTSGRAPYTYNIGFGEGDDADFVNLPAGAYQVTVTDASGCQTIETAVIESETADLITTIQNIEDAACGENNGAFGVVVNSGTAPYSYRIGENEEQNQPNFNNLSPGSYTVIVTDANGCTSDHNLTIIRASEAIDASVSNIQTASCGAENGGFVVTGTGGRAPYRYDLGNGITLNEAFTNLSGGTYEVTVTDNAGCETVAEVIIPTSEGLEVDLIGIEETTCGQNNARFEVLVENGTPPFAYNIGDGFVENSVFEDLSAGTYTITVQDLNACQTTTTITLKDGDEVLSANIIDRSPANCAQNDGAVRANVTNGTAPFTFTLNNQENNNGTFNNLAAGSYEINIIDANGCSTVLPFTITEGTEGVSGEVVQRINATCGQTNGSFTVQATSGVAPFTYNIGNGAGTSPLFQNLEQGIYDVTVTDVNGCQGTIEVQVENDNTVAAEVQNLQATTCGETNGQFQIVAIAGAAPFTYDIGNGGTTNANFSNLSSGEYEITVTDINFCSTTISVTIEDSGTPSATLVETINSSCGENNGRASFDISGGTAPFVYDLNNGQTTGPNFENLAAGVYELTITDSKGCSTFEDFTIEDSEPIEATLIGPSNAFCGEDNGSFALNVTNGVAPIAYDIGNGRTSDPNFGDLAAGTYEVTITDGQNCSTTVTAIVESSSGINFSIRKEDDFCGNGEGSITVVPTGGIAPYTYNIGEGEVNNNTFNNVFPGSYEITVTDASGCESIATTNITATSDLNVALLSKRKPTCNEDNGRIVVSAGSGVAPYTFDIGNGPVSSQTFQNLAAGNYQVTIIDAVACEATVDIVLEVESEAPSAQITEVIAASCVGNDGSFRVTATGGQSPYTYSIGQGAGTNPLFSNLNAGSYEVVVTDSFGCSTTQQIEITGTDALTANVELLAQEDCNASNASFRVTVNGGNAPYRYTIGNGIQGNNTFTNLSAGNYTVTITDARDCETTQNIQIESQNDLSATVNNEVEAACSEATGAFTVVPSGGTFPYRYNVGNGFTASPRFENLEAGNYDVTIEDTNGCRTEFRATVAGSDVPSATISTQEDATCGAANGQISFLAFGGQSPYTYDFGNGAGTRNQFTNLSSDNYILTITDANGCASTLDFSIGDSGSLPSTSFEVENTELAIELTNTSTNFDSIVWTLGDGSIYNNNSNVQHAYADAGSYTICLQTMNACGSDELCQTIQVTSSVARANLGGLVFTEIDLPVKQVVLETNATLDTAMTGEDGLYVLNRLFQDSVYTLTPSKNIDPLKGVTTYDIFLINNHILAKERLDSPYKMIAADVNRSGTISTFDVVLLRKLLLGFIDEFPDNTASWRFVAANYEFMDPENPFQEAFPEQIELELTATVNNINFIGVKTGDVNNSVHDTGEDSNNLEGRSVHPSSSLLVKWLPISSEIVVSVPAGSVALQGAFEIDANIKKFTPARLPDLSLANFGLQELANGRIRFSWNTSAPLTHAQELVRIKIDAFDKVDLSNVIQLNNTVLKGEIYTPTQAFPLHLQIEQTTDFQLLGHAPNPFKEWTNIQFELGETANVQLSIFDVQGRLQQTQTATFEAGIQAFRVERASLAAGVLFYELQIEGRGVVARKQLVAVD